MYVYLHTLSDIMRSFKVAAAFGFCLISATYAQQEEEEMGDDYIAPASISEISGVVKPGQNQDGGGVLELAWAFLTEEWWRMVVAALVLLIIFVLVCYLCRYEDTIC